MKMIFIDVWSPRIVGGNFRGILLAGWITWPVGRCIRNRKPSRRRHLLLLVAACLLFKKSSESAPVNGSCAVKTPGKPTATARRPNPSEHKAGTIVRRTVAATNLTCFCLKCGNGANFICSLKSLSPFVARFACASLPERRPALLLAWPHTRLASSRQPDIRCGNPQVPGSTTSS